MPHKPKMVWIRCEWCGRMKEVERRNLKRGQGRFCSRKCSGRWHALNRPEMFKGQAGAKNPNWKGGRTLHTRGYVYQYAPEHPRASNGYVFEHILVAEEKLGRQLMSGEVVHHCDGRKDNNHPDNIEVFANTGAHSRYHAKIRKEAI